MDTAFTAAEKLKNAAEFVKARPATLIFAALFIIAIILIYIYYNAQTYDYEKYIGGYWSADTAFCKESDITSMSLFIGEQLKCNGIDDPSIISAIEKLETKCKYVRKCYLLIEPNISSQIIYLFYNPVNTYFAASSKPYIVRANIAMSDDNLWPDDVKISFDMLDGCMKVYVDSDIDTDNKDNTNDNTDNKDSDDEPKLYARMYRDGNISEHFK